jgi:type I restriction enzyme, S subunit
VCEANLRAEQGVYGVSDEQNNVQDEQVLPRGWIHTTLGDLVHLEYGKGLTKVTRDTDGNIPVYGSSGLVGKHSEYLVEGPVIIVGRKGSVGQTFLSFDNCWPIDTVYYVKPGLYLDMALLHNS